MSETNAIETTGEGTSAPVRCCPDAKREDDNALGSSAAPLSGRRCRACGRGLIEGPINLETGLCAPCHWGWTDTVERSGPDNV